MAWAFVQDNQGTLEDYDRVRAEIGDEVPDGLIAHAAGQGPGGGVRIIDIWESEEHHERFRQSRLAPALEKVIGRERMQASPPRVETLEVHDLLKP